MTKYFNMLLLGFLVMTCTTFAVDIWDTATVYLPFEGEDTGISSDCWKNKGAVAYDESPEELVLIGDPNSEPTTIEAGIKGWCMDNTRSVPSTLSSFYRYGKALTGAGNDTALELGTMGAWSYTISAWVKPESGSSQGRWAYCPSLEANASASAIGTTWGSIVNEASTASDNLYATHTSSIDNWSFIALTYTGDPNDPDPYNFKIYYGDVDNPVELSGEMTTSVITGQLTDVRGVADGHQIVIGNHVGSRPFVGYIDEVRMWFSQTKDSNGVLSLAELEQIRSHDVVPTTCNEVKSMNKLLQGDITEDCRVDLNDFVVVADGWLDCNNPVDQNCVGNW